MVGGARHLRGRRFACSNIGNQVFDLPFSYRIEAHISDWQHVEYFFLARIGGFPLT